VFAYFFTGGFHLVSGHSSTVPNLATGETIHILLERSGGLLLEFLLKFLFLWFGMILLHYMCARIPLTDLLAFDILYPYLVLNI
jgi:hypothetical protein